MYQNDNRIAFERCWKQGPSTYEVITFFWIFDTSLPHVTINRSPLQWGHYFFSVPQPPTPNKNRTKDWELVQNVALIMKIIVLKLGYLTWPKQEV